MLLFPHPPLATPSPPHPFRILTPLQRLSSLPALPPVTPSLTPPLTSSPKPSFTPPQPPPVARLPGSIHTIGTMTPATCRQLKAQDAAVGKLREMLAQADERFDSAQAEAALKLHAAQV